MVGHHFDVSIGLHSVSTVFVGSQLVVNIKDIPVVGSGFYHLVDFRNGIFIDLVNVYCLKSFYNNVYMLDIFHKYIVIPT